MTTKNNIKKFFKKRNKDGERGEYNISSAKQIWKIIFMTFVLLNITIAILSGYLFFRINNKISFFHKPHLIHSLWKYHFPVSYGRHIKQEDRAQYLFWEDSFDFEEKINVEFDMLLREIKECVASSGVYSKTRYKIDEIREESFPNPIFLP